MATRPVGRTGLRVSEIGFGAAPLGNLYQIVSDDEARDAIGAAFAAGFRYVDTAPHYGRGLSERRVGDAVRRSPGVVVSTKVGRLMVPDDTVDDRERDGFRSPMPFRMQYDYTYDGILRSHEHSLQRLGVAGVDLLFVHDIGRRTHGDAAGIYWSQLTWGGGLRALERLRDEGAIAGFGVGANETAACLDVMREARLDAVLLAGRYTLLEQDALDDLLPACESAGTSIVIGGPFNSGILATGTRGAGQVFYDYGAPPQSVIDKVRAIESIADRYNVPLPAAALQFALAHPLVASVIPGLGSVDLVRRTAQLLLDPVPPEFWQEVRDQGLVRLDAPVPTG